MGSYGVGITRTPQAAVERYHDDKGIVWPINIAPYTVEIIPLNYAQDNHRETAEQIYNRLVEHNIDCLLDDRAERAGVKFADADLIGIPIHIVIGDKSLKQGKVELKYRGDGEVNLVSVDNIIEEIERLRERIN